MYNLCSLCWVMRMNKVMIALKTVKIVSRYETGTGEPALQELIKIADYFNVSLDYLLERTNHPKIAEE